MDVNGAATLKKKKRKQNSSFSPVKHYQNLCKLHTIIIIRKCAYVLSMNVCVRLCHKLTPSATIQIDTLWSQQHTISQNVHILMKNSIKNVGELIFGATVLKLGQQKIDRRRD